MSAISLYPMETIRVLNNVYMDQIAPAFTSAFDSSNNNITTTIIPSGPNETAIVQTKTTNKQTQTNVMNLFNMMNDLLVDISNNVTNPRLVSGSVDTLLHSLSALKNSYNY
jgi:hypothetical protein